MDLVLIVSLDGLEKEKVIKTKIGKRTIQDSEPISLYEAINWYAELSSGDPYFRRINQTSTIEKEVNHGTKWAREVWEMISYGIRYYVVTEDEANRIIGTRPYPQDEEYY